MSHQVVNGALAPARTDQDRHVVGELAVLTVKPDGKTACRVDNGIKWPGGRKVSLYIGEIDGVRAYVHERVGKVHVLLTRETVKP